MPGEVADDVGDVWIELGLRRRDVRVRCIFEYCQGGEGAQLERVFLAREGLERLPDKDPLAEVGDSRVLCTFPGLAVGGGNPLCQSSRPRRLLATRASSRGLEIRFASCMSRCL